MLQGEELLGVAQVPLAENGRGVAALLDQLRQGHFIAADADFGAGPQRAVNADAVRVAAGQQPRARGRANRLGHMEVAENAPSAARRSRFGVWKPLAPNTPTSA